MIYKNSLLDVLGGFLFSLSKTFFVDVASADLAVVETGKRVPERVVDGVVTEEIVFNGR